MTTICAFAISCDDSVAEPSGTAGAAITITAVSPTSGPIGTLVTVRGTGFAAQNNTVKFGRGYIRGLSSSDGTTIRFSVPEGLDLCSPVSTGPCQGAFPRVTPGDYTVAIMTGKETVAPPKIHRDASAVAGQTTPWSCRTPNGMSVQPADQFAFRLTEPRDVGSEQATGKRPAERARRHATRSLHLDSLAQNYRQVPQGIDLGRHDHPPCPRHG